MPQRPQDPPPRRGTEPRRGSARSSSDRDRDAGAQRDDAGFGGISDARAYTPRGRTVRETAEQRRASREVDERGRTAGETPEQRRAAREAGEQRRAGREAGEQRRTPRVGRTGDPFRPALQVVDGGKPGGGRDQRRGEGGTSAPTRERRRADDGPVEPASRRGGIPARSAAARPVAGPAPARTRVTAPAGGRGAAPARTTAARQTVAVPSRRAKAAAPPLRRVSAGRGAITGRPTASAGRRPRRPSGPSSPPPLVDPRRRLRVATVLTLAMFAVIGIRLVFLQVVDSPAHADGGLQQRLRTVALAAPRGAIYDRNDDVLARTIAGRYIYADPKEVDNPAVAAAKLQPLLGVPASLLERKLAKKKRPDGRESRFEYLARGVDVEVAQRIRALNIGGIGDHPDERRDVPGADLAANVIGFTGTEMSGLEGLEARYDQLLRGVDGERVFETGNPANLNGEVGARIPDGYFKETPAQPGSSLQLTLDADLQNEVQRILGERAKQVKATVAAAVVMDVRNGEVLAQASYPGYNAAKPFAVSKPADRQDVASSVVVDPGSVHKAIIFGAALNEGLINLQSRMVVGPGIKKGDTTFTDSHPFPQGTSVTMPGLLAFSSNVGTIGLADQLTPQKVYEYQRRFGLGEPTGVGVPGEASGRVLPPNEWGPSSYGSVPIGHSVDATTLQMAAAYAAIANDGTWIQPKLIKATIAHDGTRTPTPEPKRRAAISPKAAADLRVMLEAPVIVPNATGTAAAIPGYRVAGKTGTGSLLVNGKYTRGEVASFIGMAPADKPRYVIAVFAKTPGGGGGDVSAPAFHDMMAFTLRHFKVPPTGTRAPKFTVVR